MQPPGAQRAKDTSMGQAMLTTQPSLVAWATHPPTHPSTHLNSQKSRMEPPRAKTQKGCFQTSASSLTSYVLGTNFSLCEAPSFSFLDGDSTLEGGILGDPSLMGWW